MYNLADFFHNLRFIKQLAILVYIQFFSKCPRTVARAGKGKNMALKRIVINVSCAMFAVFTGLSILIMDDQMNMYKELHNDYMTLSNEYDKLAEENKDKTIAIETLQNTISELKSKQPSFKTENE